MATAVAAADIGYEAGCNSPTINNNYFVAKGGSSLLLRCTNVLSVSGNTFYPATNFSPSSYPNNTYESSPSGVKVFVRPNQYEQGRANITIYNWSQQPTVNVNLSGIGLAQGTQFEVRDAQNFYGPPVLYGTYMGAPVAIPMSNLSVVQPVGNAPIPAVHTPTEFGSFVVVPVVNAQPATNQPPSVSAGQAQSITLPATPTLNGTALDDGLPNGQLSTVWTKVSGPGTVTFANANAMQTTASFSAAGSYTLRLTASDGALSANNDVAVNVAAAGSFPGIRVNAGGTAYTDSQGRTWSADTGANRGATYGNPGASISASDAALYRDIRYDSGSFQYAFNVPAGSYTVNLKFAEIYYSQAGKRRFNVLINGQEVLSNFDVFAAAGGAMKPIDKSFAVNATSGTVTIQFNTLADAAMVNAIEVTADGSPSTPTTPTTPPSSPPAGNVVRVNSGGTAYTDSTGAIWSADAGFSGGYLYATGAAISGTTMSPVYQTVRYDSKPFQYTFAVANGTRTVTLHFAEVYHASAGKRVFNVAINGQPALSSFDIVAAAGGSLKALDKSFTVDVTGGQIVIQFTTVTDAAMINAIDIQ
jgi:hypothetical protein